MPKSRPAAFKPSAATEIDEAVMRAATGLLGMQPNGVSPEAIAKRANKKMRHVGPAIRRLLTAGRLTSIHKQRSDGKGTIALIILGTTEGVQCRDLAGSGITDVEEFVRKHGVTKCPTGYAIGSVASGLTVLPSQMARRPALAGQG